MQTLSIDIETYSSYDLQKCGVYRYVQAPDFEILLIGYCLNSDPVMVYEGDPSYLKKWLIDPEVLKTAHNANFERVCLNKFFGINSPIDQWECSMAKAAMLGLPLGLGQVAKVLKVQEKLVEGKALIRYFTMPCKPTKANGERTRNLPQHDPEKWEKFKNYCINDVIVERAINKRIDFFTMPEAEQKLWQLDQQINDRGILLDPEFIKNAISMDTINRDRLTTEAVELTSLGNPNSAAQLKAWLTKEMPFEVIDTLRKEDIPVLLKSTNGYTNDANITRVLEIRQEMSKTSIKKYDAMRKSICTDSRVRGLLQFYGANRTGRWAGRLIQVQNLPKNSLRDLDLARTLVAANDLENVDFLFGNVPDTLSQLIRTAFIPKKDHKFIVADFSAIEARVIAWLAGEKWRLDVFATHGKIYEASGAAMFKVPIESVTKTSELRAKAKISELALGYQGGPNALLKMGAIKMGLTEDELPGLVKMWRNANRKIVQLWDDIGQAAIDVVEDTRTIVMHGCKFYVQKGVLFIELPSGRKLAYLRPTVRKNKFGNKELFYEGMDQTTKQWKLQSTYGGKLVENIVQAIARDILADAMTRINDKMVDSIVIHVHDEIVIEALAIYAEKKLEIVCGIMSQPIAWAPGLPLAADGFYCDYYRKD